MAAFADGKKRDSFLTDNCPPMGIYETLPVHINSLHAWIACKYTAQNLISLPTRMAIDV